MDKDFFLMLLVQRVETSDFRPDITVNVGGITLIGDMISEKDFFDGFSATITSDPPELQEEHRTFFSNLPTALDELVEESAEEGEVPQDERDRVRRHFIHLTNVRMFDGGQYHEFPDSFWRGKVSAVDGFWLGSFQST